MIQWLNKITVDDKVALMTLNPSYKNEIVEFTWINVKTGKETTKKLKLIDAIILAEKRRDDKRYKNYEYHISL